MEEGRKEGRSRKRNLQVAVVQRSIPKHLDKCNLCVSPVRQRLIVHRQLNPLGTHTLATIQTVALPKQVPL